MPGDQDEMATREAIAMNNNRIAQERAFTVDRIDRLRRFSRTDLFEKREREEWRAFHERVYYLERENDVMIRALTDLHASKAPPPIFIPQKRN